MLFAGVVSLPQGTKEPTEAGWDIVGPPHKRRYARGANATGPVRPRQNSISSRVGFCIDFVRFNQICQVPPEEAHFFLNFLLLSSLRSDF